MEIFGVFDKFRHKPGYTTTRDGKRLEIFDLGRRGVVLLYAKYRFSHEDEHLSLVVRNRSSGFPTRSDKNQAVQLQKMARGMKFRI